MTVTEAFGGPYELAYRFGQELVALHGSYEIVESTAEARLSLLNRIGAWIEAEEAAQKGAVIKTGQERSILAWDPEFLPVDGLAVALEDMHLLLVNPDGLDSEQAREDIRFIRYGVTGIDAAFASTGSMLMISGPGKNRVASLLPFYHVALIPFSRLYPTVESWLAKQRDEGTLIEAMSEQANISMITGPSKSADIEMNLTLGVHGPKFLHAILFDDENDAGGLGFEAESEFDSLRFDNQFGFEEA
jgi:L-lactate dehydrogenase complex protein LldG